jgi:hypothetical protein
MEFLERLSRTLRPAVIALRSAVKIPSIKLAMGGTPLDFAITAETPSS